MAGSRSLWGRQRRREDSGWQGFYLLVFLKAGNLPKLQGWERPGMSCFPFIMAAERPSSVKTQKL